MLYVSPRGNLGFKNINTSKMVEEREERRTQEKPLNSAWSREDNWPWTGVSVGCSRVNSSSKLLVSALPFYTLRI